MTPLMFRELCMIWKTVLGSISHLKTVFLWQEKQCVESSERSNWSYQSGAAWEHCANRQQEVWRLRFWSQTLREKCIARKTLFLLFGTPDVQSSSSSFRRAQRLKYSQLLSARLGVALLYVFIFDWLAHDAAVLIFQVMLMWCVSLWFFHAVNFFCKLFF